MAGVVLLGVPGDRNPEVEGLLRALSHLSRLRAVHRGRLPDTRRELAIWELHLAPGAERVAVAYLQENYERYGVGAVFASRLPRTVPASARSRMAGPSGPGGVRFGQLKVEQWVIDELARLKGEQKGKGTTVILLDQDFDEDVLQAVGQRTLVTEIPYGPGLPPPERIRIRHHGSVVLAMAHLAAPAAALQWHSLPSAPNEPIRNRRGVPIPSFWLMPVILGIVKRHQDPSSPTAGEPVVVNLSFSYDFDGWPEEERATATTLIDQFLDSTTGWTNIVLVSAAGNAKNDTELGRMAYPASSPTTIAIGAVDRSRQRAAGSRYGKSAGLWLMAPGGAFSAGPVPTGDPLAHIGSTTFVGTSFACGFASGLVACAFGPDDGAKASDTAVFGDLTRRALRYPGYAPGLDGLGLINLLDAAQD